MAGEELDADSFEDVKIAPAQAAPAAPSPQSLRQHWSNANPNTNTNSRRATPLAATSQA